MSEIRLATNNAAVEVVLPAVAEGPIVIAFQLVDGRTVLQLSGKMYMRSLSDPAGKIFRAAIVNVLKTGGVDVLHCSCKDSATAAGENSPQLEIDSLVVSWAEWVATWETGRDVRDNPPWDRLCGKVVG